MSLAMIPDTSPQRLPTDPFRTALHRVSRAFNIPAADILGRSRLIYYRDARRSFWLLLRMRGWSFPRIGRKCGRDHTTILYGVRKLLDDIEAGTARDPAPLAGDDWREQSLPARVKPAKAEKSAIPMGRRHLWRPINRALLVRMGAAPLFHFRDAVADCRCKREARRAVDILKDRGLICRAAAGIQYQQPPWLLTVKGREWVAAELANPGSSAK